MNACEKMDTKFYIDDFEFERYLKEKADDFKMYPSKRVWNSIYNNMHPGSRWPSISMCIILICTLFLIGFLNTNTHNKSNTALAHQTNAADISLTVAAEERLNKANEVAGEQKTGADKTIPFAPVTANNTAKINKVQAASLSSNTNNNTTSSLSSNKSASTSIADAHVVIDNNAGKLAITHEGSTYDAAVADNAVNDNAGNLTLKDGNSINTLYQTGIPEKDNYYKEVEEKALTNLEFSIIPVKTIEAGNKQNTTIPAKNNNSKLSEADKFWIENYAMYNRPAPKKWKGKLSWQTYLTPSVVYRSLENTAANKNIGTTGTSFNADINNSVTHTPSVGLELGTGVQYDLTNRIKFKTGIQLNFTRYNAHAFDNGHPIATSLTMLSEDGNSAYEVYRISPYNSNYGITPVKLHNQTYQVSLPIGADYKIASAENLEWYAGASIQPTFLLAGKSYLISTDRRNYVKETGMLNRFNLNAGFETYIAIKTKGITWQIGPQFRKQLFSTNQKAYSIEERLLNYGLKIGITKKL